LGCGRATCDEDHPDVAVARRMSSETLTALFAEAETTMTQEHGAVMEIPVRTELPTFHLSPLAFTHFSDTEASVMLDGCFDHHLYLRLRDLNSEAGRIVLTWGEGPFAGERVLWSKPKNETVE
jgi:hypothetical protein